MIIPVLSLSLGAWHLKSAPPTTQIIRISNDKTITQKQKGRKRLRKTASKDKSGLEFSCKPRPSKVCMFCEQNNPIEENGDTVFLEEESDKAGNMVNSTTRREEEMCSSASPDDGSGVGAAAGDAGAAGAAAAPAATIVFFRL